MASIKMFWNWFNEHRDIFYDLHTLPESEQAYYYHTLASKLQEFEATVSYVISSGAPATLSKLTLTTNGDSEGFMMVQNLVAMAPDIPNWKIQAFIQPKITIDELIERTDPPYLFSGMSIKASDIVWKPNFIDENTGKYGLLLGFNNLAKSLQSRPVEEINEYMTTILLDVLGEFTAGKKLCALNYQFLKDDVDEDWLALHDLPVFLNTNNM